MTDPDEELKALYKEALQEWLDKQLAAVGKWTLRGIAVLILVATTTGTAFRQVQVHTRGATTFALRSIDAATPPSID